MGHRPAEGPTSFSRLDFQNGAANKYVWSGISSSLLKWKRKAAGPHLHQATQVLDEKVSSGPK